MAFSAGVVTVSFVVQVGTQMQKRAIFDSENRNFKKYIDTGWCLLAQGLQKGWMVLLKHFCP